MTGIHKLSIVIIGRNEEKGIGRCVEAALRAAEQVGGAEMIYVDSHSTDKTVSIVESHGVRVLPLSGHLPRTPSAGRFMGSKYSKGDFILFLDADTLVYPDFLPTALEHFSSDPTIAGINGRTDDYSEAGERVFDMEERSESVAEVKWLRGPCCLYRREALLKVGSFNRNLATEEEAELGLRLIRAGWKLKIIPGDMACHTRCFHGDSMESMISTFRRDIRSKRLGEITRTIAYAARAGNGFAFCWLRLKTTILFLAWAIAIIAATMLPAFLYQWLAVTLLVLFGGSVIYAKKRSLSQTLLFIPAKILNLADILAGLHKIATKPKRRYQLDRVNDIGARTLLSASRDSGANALPPPTVTPEEPA